MDSDTIVVSMETPLNDIKQKIKEVYVEGKMKHLAILSGTNYFSVIQYSDGTYDLWFDDDHVLGYASADTVAEFVFAECRIIAGFDNWRKS